MGNCASACTCTDSVVAAPRRAETAFAPHARHRRRSLPSPTETSVPPREEDCLPSEVPQARLEVKDSSAQVTASSHPYQPVDAMGSTKSSASFAAGSANSPHSIHAAGRSSSSAKRSLNYVALHQQQLQMVQRAQQVSRQCEDTTMVPVLQKSMRSAAPHPGTSSASLSAHLPPLHRRPSMKSDPSLSLSCKANGTTAACGPSQSHTYLHGTTLPATQSQSNSFGVTILFGSKSGSELQLVRPLPAPLRESVGSWLLQQQQNMNQPTSIVIVKDDSPKPPGQRQVHCLPMPDTRVAVEGGASPNSNTTAVEFDLDPPCSDGDDDMAATGAVSIGGVVLAMPVFHNSTTFEEEEEYY